MRRVGSQDVVPVTIVATLPVASSMRTRPGGVVPCSLQTIKCVGWSSLGHSEIWSSTAGPWVVTTRAFSFFASVASLVGSA